MLSNRLNEVPELLGPYFDMAANMWSLDPEVMRELLSLLRRYGAPSRNYKYQNYAAVHYTFLHQIFPQEEDWVEGGGFPQTMLCDYVMFIFPNEAYISNYQLGTKKLTTKSIKTPMSSLGDSIELRDIVNRFLDQNGYQDSSMAPENYVSYEKGPFREELFREEYKEKLMYSESSGKYVIASTREERPADRVVGLKLLRQIFPSYFPQKDKR